MNDDVLSLRPGEHVGHYVIGERVRGGEVEVTYRAVDVQSGDAIFAHALAVELDSDAACNRVCDVVREVMRIDHPNILRVRSAAPFGRMVVVATDAFEGETLREWWRSGRTWAELAAVMRCAADALAAAHRAQVVHGDVTPERLLVGPGDNLTVFGFDFGNARMAPTLPPDLAPRVPERRRIWTAAQATAVAAEIDSIPRFVEPQWSLKYLSEGTIGYIAPQLVFEGVRDPECDQFGFGVTLFEAIYGRRPYPSDNLETYATALGKGPPPLPRDPRVPRWLGRIAHRAMQSHYAKRFQSMSELRDAIDRGPPPQRWWWPWD